MNEQGMLKPALIGGVLLGILSAVPIVNIFNCACCAWVIGGAVLAANLYVKSSPAMVTLGNGALLGFLTGGIGGVVFALFSIPLEMLMKNMGMGFIEQMRQMIAGIPNMPPETRDALSSLISATGTPSMLFVIFIGIFYIIIFTLIGGLGGLLGVAIFEKRKSEPPVPTYQPPIHLPPPPPPEPPPPPPAENSEP